MTHSVTTVVPWFCRDSDAFVTLIHVRSKTHFDAFLNRKIQFQVKFTCTQNSLFSIEKYREREFNAHDEGN